MRNDEECKVTKVNTHCTMEYGILEYTVNKVGSK